MTCKNTNGVKLTESLFLLSYILLSFQLHTGSFLRYVIVAAFAILIKKYHTIYIYFLHSSFRCLRSASGCRLLSVDLLHLWF